MARKRIQDIIAELQSWLPNYDTGDGEYPDLLYRILASLPGGERLEDLGYEPLNISWHEADQLARVIDAVEDKRDVEDLVDGLLDDEDEDEEEDEEER
jgi:hypothetical protein